MEIDNETFEVETNILSSNELSNENNQIDTSDRYIKLIDALGLNINIVYPIRIILSSIKEIHTIKEKTNKDSNYSAIYRFKLDYHSKKICDIFSFYSNLFSINHLSSELHRMYRQYKYNKIMNNPYVIDKPNQIIGFNYTNPHWSSADVSLNT